MNADHFKRINRAIHFIDENLDEDLSLEKVAEAAYYSPFHFHRVFKELIKEPLNIYITRKRIEKAASILMRQKEVSISQLSLRYGFNGNSAFTRAFKKFYGMSPTEFKNSSPNRYSKINHIDSKNGKAIGVFEEYICDISKYEKAMNTSIEIKELPRMELAYISNMGLANLENTFGRLHECSIQKGLFNTPGVKMLTIYHDSFKITAPDKVRMSACVLLNAPIKVDGEIGLKTIDKGKYIIGHYELSPYELGDTWSKLFVWLNQNGCKTTERNCFEIYHNDFKTHPDGKFIVDLCIPID